MTPTLPSETTAATIPLRASGLTKRFKRNDGATVTALDAIDLEIRPGEMVVLLGPSGCGKTTLLRCVAGLEFADAGTIDLAGELVFDPSAKRALGPNKRDINMMFQTYALWLHMTLVDNVAYPLRVEGMSRKQARARAHEYLELVGIGGLAGQYAAGVSGGQQQRAALARTLVSEPALVLFDEPLSNVDAKVRHLLRAEISRLHRELGFAALYVTHDQAEALSLGDRVAVMESGRIVECDAPERLYSAPQTRFAAEFLGSANVDRFEYQDGQVQAEVLGAVPGLTSDAPNGTLMWRPEHARISLLETPAADTIRVTGSISQRLFTGSFTHYTIDARTGGQFQVWEAGPDPEPARECGDAVQVDIPLRSIRMIGA